MTAGGVAGTLVGATFVLIFATAAAAQPGPPRPPRFEAGGGLVVAGGVDFGRASADLTANEPSGPALSLFRTETSLAAGVGVEGRLGWLMTRRIAAEGGVSWVRHALETRITDDAEGVPDTRAEQDLDAYAIDLALVVHLPESSFARGRGLPFVSAGGGYLRQLDADSRLLGTGGMFHAGGGVKYFFASPGGEALRGAGVRLDARVEIRAGGFEIDPGRASRTSWRAGAAGIFRF